MAFSTKSETTKEEFKDRCNMAGNFQPCLISKSQKMELPNYSII